MTNKKTKYIPIIILIGIFILIQYLTVKHFSDNIKELVTARNEYIEESETIVLKEPSVVVFTAKPSITPIVHNQLVVKVNQLRKEKGLKPLTENIELAKGAEQRAKTFTETGQKSHEGLDEALIAAGLSKGKYAENISINFSDEQAVQAWEQSPSHAVNLFSSIYTKAGVGHYANYIVLWLSN